jgi:hypothetical protein
MLCEGLRHLACLAVLLLVSISAYSSDLDRIANARSIIDRAEKVSSLTSPASVPFFVELRFDRTPSVTSGKGGTYKLWWEARDKWRAEAQVGEIRTVEVRDDRGFWRSESTDPKADAVFSGAARFPFRGNLLGFDEKIIGLKERKVNGVKLSCVQTVVEDNQRELCFDPQTGVLIQTTAIVPVRTSMVARQFEPVEYVSEYRQYAAVGDKFLPGEIRVLTHYVVTASLRLVKVALQPKTGFAQDMFVPPAGYRMWPGCDNYRAARASKDFWKQSPSALNYHWFFGSEKVADGVRIVVGPDGHAQEVQLLNPTGDPPKAMESAFRGQKYEPAICDGKPAVGMLTMDFTRE